MLKHKSELLLTVAIPTYNRSKLLNKLLGQLYQENQKFKVVVSDNNSTDDTRKIVGKYQRKMKNLKYNKNKINVGPCQNIFKLYELSETRYIWLLADDEEILPGAVGKILKTLSDHKPIVALFNHIKTDPFGRKIEEGVDKSIVYNKISGLEDYGPLARTVFMSIIVLEKRLLPSVVKKTLNGDKKSIFFQVSLSVLMLNDKFRLAEIAIPVVFRNQTYESGEFFKFIIADILEAFCIVDHKFDNSQFIDFYKKQIFKALELYLSQKIGLFKFYGRPSIVTIKRIFKYYGVSGLFILSFPIIKFLTPGLVLKFIYRTVLQRINGRKEGRRIYRENLDRVLKFKINSGLVDYR